MGRCSIAHQKWCVCMRRKKSPKIGQIDFPPNQLNYIIQGFIFFVGLQYLTVYLYYVAYGELALRLHWRRIAPSTAQGHLRAFHSIKSYTSWIQYKPCTFYKRKTYKHSPKGSPFAITLVKIKNKTRRMSLTNIQSLSMTVWLLYW